MHHVNLCCIALNVPWFEWIALQHCVFNFHYLVIINQIYFRSSHYIYAFSLSFCQECVQVIFHTQIKRNYIYHEANEALMNIVLHCDIIFMAIKLIYLPILIIVIKNSHYCNVKWGDLILKMY